MAALTRGAATAGQGTPTTYVVTTLADSGPGSLREACAATGPRYVVFNVTGYINLTSELDCDNPYITIAGQTSPGGVCVIGFPVRIRTNDGIVRYMRFRRGSHNGTSAEKENKGESVFLSNASNIMLDHCSITWGTDETMQCGSYNGPVYGNTCSWCLIGNGLNNAGHPEANHGYSFNHSDKFFTDHPQLIRPETTIHHCYIMHGRSRNPWMRGRVLVDFVNNIIYDCYHWNTPGLLTSSEGGIYAEDIPRINVIRNYFKRGVNGNAGGDYGFMHTSVSGVPTASQEESFYVEGNASAPDTAIGQVGEWGINKRGQEVLADIALQKPTPWDIATEAQIPGVPVTATTMDLTYATTIVNQLGATYPVRDSIDQELADDFINGTGTIREDVVYPDDYPAFTDPGAWTDSNNDGIPDTFDSAHGFSTNGADDVQPYAVVTSADVTARAIDSQHVGYQWMEAYINELVQ